MRILIALVLLAFQCAVATAQSADSNDPRPSFDTGLLAMAPPEPVPVRAGIKIVQITGVDQKAENFSVVARFRMEWSDPLLASDLFTQGRAISVMNSADFVDMALSRDLAVPVGTFENLQARSFDKESLVAWTDAGDALHVRETILTLQAPDFDFRQYPFDRQVFYTRIILTAPKEFFQFVELEGFSGLGDTLGEEEWIVDDVWIEIDEAPGIAGWESSRISLGFTADRHLIYYWVRIFIPLVLLVAVSWANLFLEEYRRRIDIAGANLLVFIAFNFTVSGDLPRLGYITFLDALLLSIFVLTALTVAYNVMLRRLSIDEHEDVARRLDWHVTYWAYPLIYILMLLVLWQAFF